MKVLQFRPLKGPVPWWLEDLNRFLLDFDESEYVEGVHHETYSRDTSYHKIGHPPVVRKAIGEGVRRSWQDPAIAASRVKNRRRPDPSKLKPKSAATKNRIREANRRTKNTVDGKVTASMAAYKRHTRAIRLRER